MRPPPRDSTIVHCCPGPTTLFPRLEHQGAAPSGTAGPGVEAAAGRSCPKTLSLAWQACHSLISKPCPLHPQEHCGAHVSRLRTGKRGCAALGPGPAAKPTARGGGGWGASLRSQGFAPPPAVSPPSQEGSRRRESFYKQLIPALSRALALTASAFLGSLQCRGQNARDTSCRPTQAPPGPLSGRPSTLSRRPSALSRCPSLKRAPLTPQQACLAPQRVPRTRQRAPLTPQRVPLSPQQAPLTAQRVPCTHQRAPLTPQRAPHTLHPSVSTPQPSAGAPHPSGHPSAPRGHPSLLGRRPSALTSLSHPSAGAPQPLPAPLSPH